MQRARSITGKQQNKQTNKKSQNQKKTKNKANRTGIVKREN